MPRYAYVAQNKERILSKGELEAATEEEAIAELSERGLTPLKLKATSRSGRPRPAFLRFLGSGVSFSKNLTLFDQITLIRHLGTILGTGTDILTGIEIIREDAIKPAIREMLDDISERITRGTTLSAALERWKNQFNPIFLSLVKAGEASGNLNTILLSYAKELKNDYGFYRRLKGALVYPVILVAALAAMLVLILTVVTPRLKELFASTGSAPPFYTRMFFVASDILLQHTLAVVIVIVALIVALTVAFKNRALRRNVSRIGWYIPFFRTVEKNLVLMRFSKTLAHLNQAGFPVQQALKITAGVLEPRYEETLLRIADMKIASGASFASALEEYGNLFPKILTSVIATGEKSGQMSQVLDQMGEFYSEEVLYGLETFLTLIEPALLLVVGLIIGFIASSLIAPIYRVIGTFH